MSNEVTIDLKLGGVQSLKTQLRQLKAEIANATDPEQMAELAKQAGVLSDKIKDANDAVNVFASGSKFEQISSSFGGIKDSIMSLDFEEAAQKAATFQKVMGSIGKADITTALKGITKTVTTLGSTFVKLGAQILMNPIFLLAAVITAIVVVVVMFLKKIGVLDKIFNAIEKALKPLIDGFKALTEWLGLSTAASDDAAAKVKANNDKIIASSKERTDEQVGNIEDEIKLAQSLGKNTTKLEIEKTVVTQREAQLRKVAILDGLKELKNKVGFAADDQKAALRKQMKDENAIIKAAGVDRQVLKNKEITDGINKDLANTKAAEDEAKAAREKRRQAYQEGLKAIQKEIETAQKLVIDSGKTQQQKEVDDTTAKYDALIAEAKKYNKSIVDLEKAKELEVKKINDAAALEKAEKIKADNQIKYDIEDAQFLRLQELLLSDAEYKKLLLQQKFDEETLKLADDNVLFIELKKKLQKDLSDVDAADKIVSIEKVKQHNDAVLAAENELSAAKYGAVKGGLDMIASLAGQNKKVANALFLVDKALAIGEIIVNTQREISGYASNPTWSLLPDGGASLKIPAIAAAKIRAATSIGTIVATSIGKFMNGGGGNSGGGANTAPPSTNTATPTSPTSVNTFTPGNLYGQGNNQNNVGGQDTNTNITVTAVVSETEMTATQSNILKIKKSAEL